MHIDTAVLRQFLFEQFDDEELKQLCFDYFTDVYHDFTTGMRKSQMVQLLLEHCQEQGRMPALLAALERERPRTFAPDVIAGSRASALSWSRPPTHHSPQQIFISYAHQDRAFAQRLAADLRQDGRQVWIAPNSIQAGEKWVEAINRGLAESGIFVLVLTPQAVASRWVHNETNVAIELNSEGRLDLIPLEVAACQPPPLWRVYQRIPFQADYESGLNALRARIDRSEAGAASAAMRTDGQKTKSHRNRLPKLPPWKWTATAAAILVLGWLIISQLSPQVTLPVGEETPAVTAAPGETVPTPIVGEAPDETAPTPATITVQTPTTTDFTGDLEATREVEAVPLSDWIDVWPGFLDEQYFKGEIMLGETVNVERMGPGGSGNRWLFRGGPATIDIIVEDEADIDYLLRVYGKSSLNWDDPLKYVDFNGTGQGEQLRFFEIPDDGDYIIAIRGSRDEASRYQLTVRPSTAGSIGLNETVTGQLNGDNPGVWTFAAGPATIDVILQVGPDDAGLLMLFDEAGREMAYLDVADEENRLRLTDVNIRDDRPYTIVVRNANNTYFEYSLTVSP